MRKVIGPADSFLPQVPLVVGLLAWRMDELQRRNLRAEKIDRKESKR
jgi:hypothetical protein